MESGSSRLLERACVVERLNAQYGSEMLAIAQFYGQSPQAQNVHLADSSKASELTLEWEVLADDGTTRSQSMPLDIDMAEDMTAVMCQILEKAENAHIALCAMASQQVGDMLPTPIEFSLPPPPIRMFVLGGLATLAILAFAQPDSIIGAVVYWLLPQRLFRLALYSLAAVHFVEMVGMYLACQHVQRLSREYELDNRTRMLYTLSTLVFGLFAGTMFSRQVMKHPPSCAKKKLK